MLRFRPADVTDPDAHALLDAYFAERAAGFPVEQGEYRPTWPSAEQFTPPAGVFLVVETTTARRSAAAACGASNGAPRRSRCGSR